MQTESPIMNKWIEQACNKKGVETLRTALLGFLRGRYAAPVPNDIAETINMQPSEQMLNEWCEQAGILPTIDAFRAYLRR